MTEEKFKEASNLHSRLNHARKIVENWERITHFTDMDERVYLEIPKEVKVLLTDVVTDYRDRLALEFQEMEIKNDSDT